MNCSCLLDLTCVCADGVAVAGDRASHGTADGHYLCFSFRFRELIDFVKTVLCTAVRHESSRMSEMV